MALAASSPVPTKRLEQIASDVCNSVFAEVEYYEHRKTPAWNETIIQKMLKAVQSEATPQGASANAYKFIVNSTIVQHLVASSQLNRPLGGSDGAAGALSSPATAAPAQAGRRGMHSATGAYWNDKLDGMFSYKYNGENRGLDVVIMLIWIAV